MARSQGGQVRHLLGLDLAGWRIEVWYELRLSVDEYGYKYNVGGYFSNEELAKQEGVGKGWYGGNGTVEPVFVLTNDGVSGYVFTIPARKDVNEGEKLAGLVLKKEEAERRDEAIRRAKSKLTTEELKLLGLDKGK